VQRIVPKHDISAQAAEAPVNATRGHAVSGGTRRSMATDAQWLDLDVVADVTIVAGGRRVARVPGFWSAESPGEQMILIRFHHRTPVRRLRVVSSAVRESRTHEMTIWVSLRGGERHREVLRKQFDFSPNGGAEEVEEYALQLEEVSAIQLRIVPGIDGRSVVARVSEIRVASV
jgi:hypothetical protein